MSVSFSKTSIFVLMVFLVLNVIVNGQTDHGSTLNVSKRILQVDFVQGVDMVSWTAGELPVSSSWKRQTWKDSQAVTRASIIADKNSFRGAGCLRLNVDLVGGSKNKRNGEVFVDLRYPPVYNASHCFTAPVNLEGKLLYAMVFCPKGSGGAQDKPSGLQIFAKSGDGSDWASFYGNWHNIYQKERSWSADPQLGDVQEGRWSLVTVKLQRQKPKCGYMDEGFDPTRVIAVGLKIGLNDKNNNGNYKGTILVDQFGWADSLFEIPPEGNVGVHSPADYDYYFSHYYQPECAFEFETTITPVDELEQNNYNTISIVVTQYMEKSDSNVIAPDKANTNSDQEIEELIASAKQRGLQVFLKPHVDVKELSPEGKTTWRGDIHPADIDLWFESYKEFITHYALIAEKYKLPLFMVGTEFKSLQGDRFKEQWKQVIDEVRKVFTGQLTYCANWNDYDNVSFWEELDYIGIDAYFPLSNDPDPSLESLMEGWNSFELINNDHPKGEHHGWKQELADYYKKIGRPILFTELGYRSVDYAARRPWEYEDSEQSPVVSDVNQDLQLRCFQSALNSLKGEDWFKGFLVWYWSPKMDTGGPWDRDYSTQHKKACSIFDSPTDL